MWKACPRRWELAYVKKLKKSEPSIHFVFGNAVHTVIQNYLEVLYEQTAKKADQINLEDQLFQEMVKEVQEVQKKHNELPWTVDDLSEFWNDGKETLNFFRKNRNVYYSKKKHALVGYEIPMYFQVLKNYPKVWFLGYIDLVTGYTPDNTLILDDIKTSTRGWKDWDKKDKKKTDQVLLYKTFLAEKLKIDPARIQARFIIFKRKIDENNLFPQKRIQVFEPASGKVSLNRVKREFEEFITDNFNVDGSYLEYTRRAVRGPKGNNCKFCEFKDKIDLCPLASRLDE